jgi:hypothetical protein
MLCWQEIKCTKWWVIVVLKTQSNPEQKNIKVNLLSAWEIFSFEHNIPCFLYMGVLTPLKLLISKQFQKNKKI